MKLGISTYSLFQALKSGEMSVLDVIQWAADNGSEHVELSPLGYSLVEQPKLIDAVKEKAAGLGIELSNYAVGANFLKASDKELRDEIKRVQGEVDIAAALGVKLMRHDVAWRPIGENGIEQFERDLPVLADACREVADYAARFGITTSVENHGFFVQAADRVQRLIQTVNRPNYKTTLDIGNFMCVDENAVTSVKKNMPFASMVHLKDFYLRSGQRDPGQGWFQTAGGNYLRGAIVGQGDIDMWSVVEEVKRSGYDGFISIEFEGMEDCKVGTKIGLENARRMWDSVAN